MGNRIEQTFLETYQANTDALFRHILFRIGGDRDKAKDLLQETFCRAWKVLAGGKEIENLRAYFYRIAHNLIIDEYGKHKNVSLEQMMEEVEFDPADTGSQSNPGLGAEITELQNAINKLEQESRTVLVMRYIDDLGPNEIANILGERANVISVRINRATKALKKVLHIENE
ncbi:MAG: RNA polymerase sigma factor [Patescibacteria group bacterium]